MRFENIQMRKECLLCVVGVGSPAPKFSSSAEKSISQKTTDFSQKMRFQMRERGNICSCQKKIIVWMNGNKAHFIFCEWWTEKLAEFHEFLIVRFLLEKRKKIPFVRHTNPSERFAVSSCFKISGERTRFFRNGPSPVRSRTNRLSKPIPKSKLSAMKPIVTKFLRAIALKE